MAAQFQTRSFSDISDTRDGLNEDPGYGYPALDIRDGNTDRFKAGHALPAAVLPKGRVWEIDGGHDWDAWRAGWSAFIETDAAQLASAGGISE